MHEDASGRRALILVTDGDESCDANPSDAVNAARNLFLGFAKDGLDPARGAMFEDDSRNLAVPHALGMQTVHVAPKADQASHIHHHTDDLLDRCRQRVGFRRSPACSA